jgi:hypothetical protein
MSTKRTRGPRPQIAERRCLHCKSDQLEFVRAVQTIIGWGKLYRCASCGEETIRGIQTEGGR